MKRALSAVLIVLAAGLGAGLGLRPRGEPAVRVAPPEATPLLTPAAYDPVGLEDSAHPTGQEPAPPPPANAGPPARMVGPDGTPIERAG